MDQAVTLSTCWQPDTPLDDSILRQFVFAYANRVAWMARATGGRVDRDPAACIADAGSGFGYDNAAVLLQSPAATDLLGVLGRAYRLFPAKRWWVLLSAWPLPGPPPDGMSLVGHPPLMLRPLTIWEPTPTDTKGNRFDDRPQHGPRAARSRRRREFHQAICRRGDRAC